jgi:hypothetical protein
MNRQSPAAVVPMISETPNFISAVFELFGLSKAGSGVGRPMKAANPAGADPK